MLGYIAKYAWCQFQELQGDHEPNPRFRRANAPEPKENQGYDWSGNGNQVVPIYS